MYTRTGLSVPPTMQRGSATCTSEPATWTEEPPTCTSAPPTCTILPRTVLDSPPIMQLVHTHRPACIADLHGRSLRLARTCRRLARTRRRCARTLRRLDRDGWRLYRNHRRLYGNIRGPCSAPPVIAPHPTPIMRCATSTCRRVAMTCTGSPKRGLPVEPPLLVVLDGAKGLRAAVRDRFGDGCNGD